MQTYFKNYLWIELWVNENFLTYFNVKFLICQLSGFSGYRGTEHTSITYRKLSLKCYKGTEYCVISTQQPQNENPLHEIIKTLSSTFWTVIWKRGRKYEDIQKLLGVRK
jgi:hypothetical protein